MEIKYTLKDLDSIANLIIKKTTSKILLFDAEMGMGKTTLIKAIVKALGSNDNVSSPTFSLVNEYQSSVHTIFHFDLYRIETEEELYDFGIEDYLNTNAWLLIEWPEIASSILPENAYKINISGHKKNFRFINMS